MVRTRRTTLSRPGAGSLCALWLFSLLPGSASAASVTYASRRAAGVSAHVITIDLRDPRVKVSVVTARGFPGGDEPFPSMVKRSGAVAAINGACFDKQTKLPIGDLVADGRVLREGRMGTALAITPGNQALFGRVEWGHSIDWTGYETVLACGPTLVKGGVIDLRVAEERFRDPHVLGAGVRSAVGLTADQRLLWVSVPARITLGRLAQVMRALGCVDAMNLDGGASQAMYYRGRTVIPAGRPLTNILVVCERGRHVALPPPRTVPHEDGWRALRGEPPHSANHAAPALESDGGETAPPSESQQRFYEELAACETEIAQPPSVPACPGMERRKLPRGTDLVLYTAPAPIASVIRFYRERLGERVRVTLEPARGQMAILRVVSDPGPDTLVQLIAGGSHSTTLRFFRSAEPTPPDGE